MNRRRLLELTALSTPLVLTASKTLASEPVIGHGDFRYRLNKTWSKADHRRVPLKNCHEMIQAKDGHLFLLTDQAKNNVLIYETDGSLVDTWTLDLKRAHGLTYDPKTNHLWIVDTGGRVLETTLEGDVLRELPTARAAGAYQAGQAYAPTEVAVGPDGSLFVADGYGSQYILKFDPQGSFVKKFGGKSTQAVNRGKFMQAHGVALDSRGPEPLILCSARIKNEFVWFDLDGNLKRTAYLPGAFISRPVIAGKQLYSGICFGFKPNDYRMWQGQGFVVVMDEKDRVLSCPGAAAPKYEGEGLRPLMKNSEAFNNVHDVCVDANGDLYACQWASGNVPPYKLERV